jgi:hypothetical protein
LKGTQGVALQHGRAADTSGEPIMSGWLRIGVALSVLWAIVIPTLFMFNHNLNVYRTYDGCLKLEYQAEYQAARPEGLSAREVCKPFMDNAITPLYFVTGHDAGLFWTSLILLPLALFWILGGVIFWTVRWIQRGFTNAK